MFRQFAISLLLLISIIGCARHLDANAEAIRFKEFVVPDRSGQAMTVRGAVAPEALGEALMHEHLYIKAWIPLDQEARWKLLVDDGFPQPPKTEEELAVWNAKLTQENLEDVEALPGFFHKDGYTLDVEDTLPEIIAFRERGGGTIVDMPPIEEPRRPLRILELSERSGVHIVVGTSFYTPPFYPQEIFDLTVDDLTEFMVRDLVVGMDGTDLKAGIIGETPAVNIVRAPEDNIETRVLRAAARAARLTGAALSLHTTYYNHRSYAENGARYHLALDIIEEEGLDLSRVVFGHVTPPYTFEPKAPESVEHRQQLEEQDQSYIDVLEGMIERGVYIQFDLLSNKYDYNEEVYDMILQLIGAGYADRLMFSHDIFAKMHLTKFGGPGLTFIHREVLPALLRGGASEQDIRKIMVDNPREVLTFVAPQNQLVSE